MTTRLYALPVEQTRWIVPGMGAVTVFDWNYDATRDGLLALYEKGKTKQWNSNERLDWSQPVDLSNPLGLPDETLPLFGSSLWDRLEEKERARIRLHSAAWRFSNFLHGEQGALICAAKIVQTVPDLDSKFYAATQVMDEARHVEVYSRYLREKLGIAYPINPDLKTLLDQAITDSRWDITYLAMQVIIEGLALAAFGEIRETATEPLGMALNAYVMQDEARHVAFGRLALRDYYPRLTEKERNEREDFAIEACHLMRDRFMGEELWSTLGLDAKACLELTRNSSCDQHFIAKLFSRIVPTIKDIGLWGPRIQKAFTDMGVIGFADTSAEELSRADEEVAAEFDRLRAARDAHVRSVIEGSGQGSR
jgi:hypothetical protein